MSLDGNPFEALRRAGWQRVAVRDTWVDPQTGEELGPHAAVLRLTEREMPDDAIQTRRG